MSVTDSAVDPSAGRPRLVLLILATIEFLRSVSSIAVLLDDDPTIPGPGLGGFIISATIVLVPVFALAAAVLAGRRRIAYAIVALAVVVLLSWVSLLPSVVLHWAEFPSPGVIGAIEVGRLVAFPLLALAAIVLATRNERLGLATACVAIPTIADLLAVLAFGIGVAIYGF